MIDKQVLSIERAILCMSGNLIDLQRNLSKAGLEIPVVSNIIKSSFNELVIPSSKKLYKKIVK